MWVWFTLRAFVRLAGFNPIRKVALIGLTLPILAANAYAVPVTVEVDWPNWSSDNRVIIRNSSGTTLATICDPTNCYNAIANSSYSNTFNYDFPAGTNYSIQMDDAWGDAWNGNAYVRVYSDGDLVIDDDGPPATTQTLNFDVAESPTGPQLCYGRPYNPMNFSAPTLISGTALQAGARYRYSNVAANTDAIVEITAFNNGGSLDVFDNDASLVNNFQPELNTGNSTSVDFRFDFIDSTTDAPVAIDFVASGIDIDGNNGALKEYVEFDRSSNAYALENPTELEVDTTGPSSPTRRRFQVKTFTQVDGIDPDVSENIVAAFYENKTGFVYRFGTLGTLNNSERLTSLGFDCPSFSNPVFPSDPVYDYGDAPVASYGNPRHTIVSGIRLGAINNADAGPYDSGTASGDTGDDGVTIPTLTQGGTEIITADVTGPGGYLRGWIDFDGDGSFETSELVIDDEQTTTGTITQNINVPVNATTSPTYARFRWTTTQNMSPDGNFSDGEVEDYQLTIAASPYPPPPPSGGGDGGVCILTHHQNTGVNAEPDSFYRISDHTSPSTLTKIGDWDITSGTIEGLTADVAAETLYALNANRGGSLILGTVNANTGGFTDIGSGLTTLSHSVHGTLNVVQSRAIAHQPGTNDLWVAAYNTQPTTGPGNSYAYLFKINSGTGALVSGAFSGEDYLAIDLAPYTLVNSSDRSTVEAMVFNRNYPGVLYGVVSTHVSGGSPKGGHLFAVDVTQSNPIAALAPTNLSGQPISGNTVPTSSIFDVEGMSFDENGDLIIISSNVGSSSLYIVDAGTGTAGSATPIITGDWEGLVCDPVFAGAAVLDADKSVAAWDPVNEGLFSIPGNDVIYTISVTNTGEGATDIDSIDLIDVLPPEVEFWNGDVDAGGANNFPGTDPVGFTQSSGAGLTFTYNSDVRFGMGTTKPANFAACSTVAPTNTYRSDLTFICFNPKGAFAAGDPDPIFSLSFRAKIK